jgi:stigma-specific protein Stig1
MAKSGWSAASAAGIGLLLVASAGAWAGCAKSAADTTGTTGAGGSGGGPTVSATSAGTGVTCPGSTLCAGACTNTTFDRGNCGACDHACAAGEVCSASQCGVTCLGGSTQCGDKCVTTTDDPANCGACGKACAAGEYCSASTCAAQCLGGSTECTGKCVDTQIDAANCGGCAKPCAAGEVCSAGKCGVTCLGGALLCGTSCVDSDNDPANCGACNKACGAGEVCVGGACGLVCSGGTSKCGAKCVDKVTDPKNCGSCGVACPPGDSCVNGACGFCQPGFTQCNATCVDETTDPKNCGGCNVICAVGTVCSVGGCADTCAAGLTACGQKCLDTTADVKNCGTCGKTCAVGETCKAGACAACDSATTDCDGDGWLVADGDCCDKPGLCGSQPELVNPGALEVVGNGLDDNCNGKTDLFDALDTVACDSGLMSSSTNPIDFAKALGICRQTQEQPLLLKDKTWGLIDAKILRADGSPLQDFEAISIRNGFGSIAPATTEGTSVVVISSGSASDATQTMPGPNGGPLNGNVSTTHTPGSTVNISSSAFPHTVKDWYATPNPPLKDANALPDSPGCSTAATPTANDSVALYLRLRAPTNAKAFSFNSYFFSAEYPEFVCTTYNDQFIALVDTPNGTPKPIANPIDKNLMTYTQGGQQWPIGINIAKGTSLFAVCDTQAANPLCWDNDVSASSCSLGSMQLAGTGFEAGGGFDNCTIGGGTYWLTTAGNVIPGDIVELRIAIWDVGDTSYDSLAVLDGFQWLTNATLPGTGN